MTTNAEPNAQRLVDDLLTTSAQLDESGAARRRARFEDQAERVDALDVAYRTVDSPLGPLLIAATSEGLVRVAFDCEDHAVVLTRLAADLSPRIVQVPRRLDDVAGQLDEYFAGHRRAFEISLDFRLVRGFRRTVLAHLCEIAYGTTESYAVVAVASGSPAAVRAVGSACANNPLPLVVPCHRVVRSDGTIGQYRGGTEAKRALLAMEAV